jgi:hypothetical protein
LSYQYMSYITWPGASGFDKLMDHGWIRHTTLLTLIVNEFYSVKYIQSLHPTKKGSAREKRVHDFKDELGDDYQYIYYQPNNDNELSRILSIWDEIQRPENFIITANSNNNLVDGV